MKLDTLVSDDTLARSLRPAAVDFSRLSREHGPLLQIVRLLIGVVPNCDPVLAIWPTGFRTYNLLVPNLLNLPFSVWGFGPPAVTLGLALCAASRAAQCAYCTAHTCSFTLRRGSSREKLAGILIPSEKAAVLTAEALAGIPCSFTADQRQELLRHFSAAKAERIALGVALMGFLNKFMDAVGVDLEGASMEEVAAVLQPTGWTPGKHRVSITEPADPSLQARPTGPDTVWTKLALLRHLPGAIRLEQSWVRGVPSRWPAVGRYLKAHTGHDFPVLAKVRSRRSVRAIATVLRDNLSATESRLGLPLKALSGLVYATVIGNEPLAREARSLVAQVAPALDGETLETVVRFAAEPFDAGESGMAEALARLEALPGIDSAATLALLLAKAISPSPARVPAQLVARVSRALSPEAQVELVVWVAVQQMLHRLGSYLDA
jgi:alkylhydroperoxidase family enzyme